MMAKLDQVPEIYDLMFEEGGYDLMFEEGDMKVFLIYTINSLGTIHCSKVF